MEPLLAACLVLPLFVGGQSLTPSEFEARVDDTLNKVSQFQGQNCCQISLGHLQCSTLSVPSMNNLFSIEMRSFQIVELVYCSMNFYYMYF